jgi:DHA2 family multidrug resistance protein
MVWWELTPRNRHPIVNFRVLKNRELAASIFLFVALGFGLYGGIFIFPLFTQSLLHFTPTETGLALLPGGLATAVTALICGRLLSGARPLVDPRVLIAIGVAIFVLAMWDLGHLTTNAGEPDVRLALIIRGAGLGFLFTPINNVAYASLEPSEAQQAAGLINLARQLGGSFGIAILATYITVHTQVHRVDLIANVYPGQRLVDERVQLMTANLIAHGYGPDAAHRGALALLDQQVMRQASMLSYNDAWMLLLFSFIVVSPAIFFLRKPRGGSRATVDAH